MSYLFCSLQICFFFKPANFNFLHLIEVLYINGAGSCTLITMFTLSVRQTDATPRHGGPSLAVRCTKCLQPDGAINR